MVMMVINVVRIIRMIMIIIPMKKKDNNHLAEQIQRCKLKYLNGIYNNH